MPQRRERKRAGERRECAMLNGGGRAVLSPGDFAEPAGIAKEPII